MSSFTYIIPGQSLLAKATAKYKRHQGETATVTAEQRVTPQKKARSSMGLKSRTVRCLERKAAETKKSKHDQLLPISGEWTANSFQQLWWRILSENTIQDIQDRLDDTLYSVQHARAVTSSLQKEIVQSFVSDFAKAESDLKHAQEDVESASQERSEALEQLSKSRRKVHEIKFKLQNQKSFLDRFQSEIHNRKQDAEAQKNIVKTETTRAREELVMLQKELESLRRQSLAQKESAHLDERRRIKLEQSQLASQVQESLNLDLEKKKLSSLKERKERIDGLNKELKKQLNVQNLLEKTNTELKRIEIEKEIYELQSRISTTIIPRLNSAERERDKLQIFAQTRPAYTAAGVAFSGEFAKLFQYVTQLDSEAELIESRAKEGMQYNFSYSQRLDDEERGIELRKRKQKRLNQIMKMTVDEIAEAEESYAEKRLREMRMQTKHNDLAATIEKDKKAAAAHKRQRDVETKTFTMAASDASEHQNDDHQQGKLHPLAVSLTALRRHGDLLRSMLERLRTRVKEQKQVGQEVIKNNLSTWEEENLVVLRETEAVQQELDQVAREDSKKANSTLHHVVSRQRELSHRIKELTDLIESESMKCKTLETAVSTRKEEGKELRRAAKQLRPLLEKSNRLSTDMATSVAEAKASLGDKKAELASMRKERDTVTTRCEDRLQEIKRLKGNQTELTKACEEASTRLSAKKCEIEANKLRAQKQLGDWSVTAERSQNKKLKAKINKSKEDLSDLEMLERQVAQERESRENSLKDGYSKANNLTKLVHDAEKTLEEHEASNRTLQNECILTKQKCRRKTEKDNWRSDVLTERLRDFSSRAESIEKRVQAWKTDFAAWKDSLNEEKARKEQEGGDEPQAASESPARVNEKISLNQEEMSEAEKDAIEQKSTEKKGNTKPKSKGKTTKKQPKKKKKKKNQAKNERSSLDEVAVKEKIFLDRRFTIMKDMSALEAELKSLSDENDRADCEGREGLVKKLREEVAAANTTSQTLNLSHTRSESIGTGQNMSNDTD